MWLSTIGRPRPAAPSVLCADLRLRFGERRLAGRVHWPVGPVQDDALPVVLLVPGPDPGSNGAAEPAFSAHLCRTAPAIVICLSRVAAGRPRRSPMLAAAMAALGWAADHAEELGGLPAALAVGGLGTGGAQAAWLAITTRDEGWPWLRHQLLVHPRFDAVFPLPPHPAGVAPATVITGPHTRAAGHAYAELLRRHGTDVRECVEGRLDGAELLDPTFHHQRGTP